MDRNSTAYRFVQLWLYGPITALYLVATVAFVRNEQLLANQVIVCLLTTFFFSAIVLCINWFERTNNIRVPSAGRLLWPLGVFAVVTGSKMAAHLMRKQPDLLSDLKFYSICFLFLVPFFLFFEFRTEKKEVQP